jgi:hypothetical protein
LNILYRLSALPFAKHIFHIDVSSSPDPSDWIKYKLVTWFWLLKQVP